MMPPISGIQAIAAATFECKQVDVDFGPGSGPELGGGAGGIGCWSGMTYIHKMADALSSNSATGRIRPQANLRHHAAFFAFARDGSAISCVLNPQNLWSRVPLAFFIAVLR